jgi:aspartyl-tRNA(Asn)/glutamyl-tRNA(Gln) amidotransferase subunit C
MGFLQKQPEVRFFSQAFRTLAILLRDKYIERTFMSADSPASLDSEQIKTIARLARLAVDNAGAATYARDLSAILKLAEQMQAIDTSAVQPLAHPLDMVQRLRPDRVTETDRRESYQALAPQVEAGLYLVPRVIE